MQQFFPPHASFFHKMRDPRFPAPPKSCVSASGSRRTARSAIMTLRHAKDASCAIPATFPAVLAGVVWHVFRLSGLRKTGVSVRRRRRTFKWAPELHALAISGHERVWGGTQMSPQGANDVRFRPDLDRLR
jgi:hypothetical protein